MLGCGKVLSVGGVVQQVVNCRELVRRWCPLVVFVAGVRVVEFGTKTARVTMTMMMMEVPADSGE